MKTVIADISRGLKGKAKIEMEDGSTYIFAVSRIQYMPFYPQLVLTIEGEDGITWRAEDEHEGDKI